MSSDLERGDDVTEIDHDGWLILWDGTEGSWLRMFDALDLGQWR